MTDRELMSRAKKASLNAYVPYSRFAVGAAIECSDGTVFTGCNVENAALGSTICAERTACCKAVSEGHREFRRIAIYADSENWCTPCGACRQFLAEFSPEMEVLCAKAGDRYVSYKLSDLLPYTFNYGYGAGAAEAFSCRGGLGRLLPGCAPPVYQPLHGQPRRILSGGRAGRAPL